MIFKLCRNFIGDKHDIVVEKCIKKDDGSITFSDAEKPTAWEDHYKRLLNIEFSWDAPTLENVPRRIGYTTTNQIKYGIYCIEGYES